MKRSLSLLLTAVLAASILSGCRTKPGQNYTAPRSTAPVPTEKPATLKFGLLPGIEALPLWEAEKHKLFTQQGVNVELVPFTTATERDAALSGGQVDGALADPVAAVKLAAAGGKVQITSLGLGATPGESAVGIVAGPNSGLTELAQLKGLPIAAPVGTVEHYAVEKLLLENGFKPEEIKLTDMPDTAARYKALFDGKVKAALLPDPYLTMAGAQGPKPGKVLVTDAKSKESHSAAAILFTAAAVQEQADAIKRFYIAYNLGVNEIKLAPKDALALLRAKGPVLTAAIAYPNDQIPFSFAQPATKAELESVAQWLLDKQLIKAKPAIDSLINSSLLPTK
jgi:NitT/TauT family transport system substrate-binding protein